jgi:hypothetical protein
MAKIKSPEIYDPYLGKMYGNILDQYDNPSYNIRLYLKPEENSTVEEPAAATPAGPPPIDGDLAGSDEFQSQDARSDQPSAGVSQTRTVADKKIVILAQTGVTGVQIDDLEIMTSDQTHGVSDSLRGSFKIVQPGAANFLDQLQWARKYLGTPDDRLSSIDFSLYIDINFLGYDTESDDNEAGGDITQIVDTTTYKIQLTSIGVTLDNTGSQYNCEFFIQDTIGFADEIYKAPKNISIQGSTITEFLSDLQTKYNESLKQLSTEYSESDRVKFNLSALINSSATQSLGTAGEQAGPLYISDESIPTPDTDQTVETTTVPVFNGEVRPIEEVRRDADGSQITGKQTEQIIPGAVLTIKEGNTVYSVIAQVLSMNKEFQSYVSRMKSLDDPGNNEVDNKQTFVAWFDVHCEIKTIGWDKKRNKYAKEYIYTPYIISDVRSDVALTTVEAEFLSETADLASEGEYPITAVATKRLQDLYNAGVLHKSYFYTFTGLNDQIINLDINYDFAHTMLMPPKGGFAGDYSVTNSSATRNSLPVNADPTNDDSNKAALETKNKESLVGLLDKIRGSIENIKSVADAIGRAPDELAGILNGSLDSTRRLAESLDSGTVSSLVKKLGGSDGSDPTDTPTTNTEITVTSFGEYTPEVSGFLYAADFVQPGGALTQEELQQAGLIPIDTPTNSARPTPQTRSVPSPLSGVTSDGPASVLMGYVYRSRGDPGFLLNIEMTIRGDPYWLSSKNSGKFEFGKPTPDKTTNPSGGKQFYFLLTIGTPNRFDYDVSDEDNNTGYWSDGRTSGVFSGLYWPTTWTHRFSGGIFTTILTAAKEHAVPLQWIRRVPPGETPPAWDEILKDVDQNAILAGAGLSSEQIGSNDRSTGANEPPGELLTSNPTPPNASGFANPLGDAAASVSSGFGPRRAPTAGASSNHGGVDLRAPAGTPIRPSKAGTVTRAEFSKSYGWVVYVDHGDGVETRYAHMQGRPLVSNGDSVTPNTVLGGVGRSGTATGNHLHYEVRVNDTPVDPLPYLGGGG